MTAPATPRPQPDFANTEETFRHLSDGELRRAGWLFMLMGKSWLTNLMSGIGAKLVKWGIPGAAWGVKTTIYRQFVGGTSLETALPTIERLHGRGVRSILDYGVEAKSTEEAFKDLQAEVRRAIEFCVRAPAANSVVVKVTGIASNDVLEDLNDSTIDFNGELSPEFQRVVDRLDSICRDAHATTCVVVYLDAEESWFQNTIDQLADEMMRRYNTERVVVLNTFQLYRHDRLEFLKASHAKAEAGGYMLGTKLVRGAYMVKEGARAEDRGYPTPIQPNIEATHRDFNAAVKFCLERYERIACMVGSHNQESMRLAVELLDELGVPRDHPHIGFAQLLGMSDNLTFNLAAAGANASKYMVYGPVTEVLPYLVRRAQENTSVTGEMGRELRLIQTERKRRKGR